MIRSPCKYQQHVWFQPWLHCAVRTDFVHPPTACLGPGRRAPTTAWRTRRAPMSQRVPLIRLSLIFPPLVFVVCVSFFFSFCGPEFVSLVLLFSLGGCASLFFFGGGGLFPLFFLGGGDSFVSLVGDSFVSLVFFGLEGGSGGRNPEHGSHLPNDFVRLCVHGAPMPPKCTPQLV